MIIGKKGFFASAILLLLASCGKDYPEDGLSGGLNGNNEKKDNITLTPQVAMFSSDGGEVTVKVSSPGVWFLLPGSYDWVKASVQMGMDGDEVTFKAEANPGPEGRGPVVFTFTSGMKTAKFIASQI